MKTPEEARGLRIELRSASGANGGAEHEVIARALFGRLELSLGADSVLGPRAPERFGAILGAAWELAGSTVHAELRERPAQQGAARAAAELGVRRDGPAGALALLVQVTQAQVEQPAPRARPPPRTQPALEFRSAGLALEAERDLATAAEQPGLSLRGALHLAAAANALHLRTGGATPPGSPSPVTAAQPGSAGPRSAGPTKPADPETAAWEQVGRLALEWPARWEALASLRLQRGAASLTASAAALGLPAPGASAARAGLEVEIALGRTTLGLGACAQRTLPSAALTVQVALTAAFRLVGSE